MVSQYSVDLKSMNVLIIPSWYPTVDFPIAGIFIRDEVIALGRNFPTSNFGVSLWGSHDRSLWLDKKSWYDLPKKLNGLLKKESKAHISSNCVEYYSPAYTWTRKVLAGNISGILEANRANLLKFQAEVGTIDLIHAHVSHPAGVIAQLLAVEFDVPYLITEHMGPFPFKSLQDKSGEPIVPIKRTLASSAAVVCASKFLCDKLVPFCKNYPIQIPNLVDTSLFLGKENQRNNKIAFIGRLEIEKGVQDLIDAWTNIAQDHPDWTLEFVGEGSLYKSTDHEQIQWAGEMKQNEIVYALQNAAFLALPSHFETFGKVLIEAMSVGIPVLATKCGGPEEIVNSSSGLLVSAHDLKGLAAAIVNLINTHQDYDSEAIRGIVEEKYGAEIISNRIMCLYQEISAAHK